MSGCGGAILLGDMDGHTTPEDRQHTNQLPEITVFYGETCPYCRAIMPVLARLEGEGVAHFELVEVWNNTENNARMEALSHLYEEECGGNMVVPSLYDARGGRLVCNPGSYENIKMWLKK